MATVKTAKVPLEINQPLTGTVKYVSYYPEKPGTGEREGKVDAAQWGLTGSWTWIGEDEEKMAAEGRVYIHEYMLANSPLQSGLAVEDGKWDDGNPKYKWVYPQPVRVSKRQPDKTSKKLQVSITRLTELPTATGAAPTPQAASTGRATAEVTRSSSSVAPVAVPPNDEAWDALARVYKRSAAIAIETWMGEDGSDPDPDDGSVIAATATIFIEANKRGLTVPAPHVPLTAAERAVNVQQAQQQFKDKPEVLDGEDSDLPF